MTTALGERIQHQLLPRVSKPNRYLSNGLEAGRKPLNVEVKNVATGATQIALTGKDGSFLVTMAGSAGQERGGTE